MSLSARPTSAAPSASTSGAPKTSAGRSLVSIKNLSYSYSAQNPALDDISLEIAPLSITGLIGPNGGGKTTLLKLLLAQLTPDSGTIEIDGLPPAKALKRGDILGYLPQHTPTTSTTNSRLPLTVREAVRLGLVAKTGLLRTYSKDDLAFVDALLPRVGLSGMEDKSINALSGGQLQRVYIARALAPRPKLLLLDEPTTGIDRGHQQMFIDLIASLRSELGLTILLVSHDLRAVTSIADKIACLNSTLHYHDIPQAFPPALAQNLFCCDLEAMGLPHGEGDTHHHCSHPHPSNATPIAVTQDFVFRPTTGH